MAKVYYIVVSNADGVVGPMMATCNFENAQRRESRAEENILIDKGVGRRTEGFAIFERRSQARKGKAILAARAPRDISYQIRELGETQRDCKHKVKGWVLVFMKDIVSMNNETFNRQTGRDYEMTTATFDMFGEECTDYPIFKRRDQAREAAKYLNTDDDGKYIDPPGKRDYSIVPIYA